MLYPEDEGTQPLTVLRTTHQLTQQHNPEEINDVEIK